MKKKKKIFSVLLVSVLVGVLLDGCGTKDIVEDASKDVKLTEIVVGASIEPHSSILNSDEVKKELATEGFSIKVVEYTDYIQPNSATEDGSLDANFFQHLPYLTSFNEENGTKLVSVADIHFEPLGIYPGKTATLEEIVEGATIAVPNDETNEARALILLANAGWITLPEDTGLDVTVKDIIDNPKKLKIKELEAAQTAKVLQDVDFSVINGNYALTEGLSASENALLVEDVESEAAKTFANIVVVKEGNENTDKTKALVKAVTSAQVKTFIEEKWQGAVVPVF
jgi:D-methionine transport system substrate-binding protein